MQNSRFSRALAVILLASTAALLSESPAEAQSRYGGNAHPAHNSNQFGMHRYAGGPQMRSPKKYKNLIHRMRDQRHIAYQTPPPPGMFQQWVDWEPEYRLVPGDQLDIVVSSAPELSRTLTVGPDGRVVMPMSRPIMAAGRSFVQVQNELMGELGKQLRDPRIAVTPRAYAPEQIYVGGQVGQPGTYTIPSRIGALEAILMAGGMRPTAQGRQVAVLRRAPNGGMMMRTVNIRNGLLNIREYNDNMQLRRGDIIFVPQSNIAEIGTFMQNFRNALPVDFNLSYQFGNNNGGTTVVSP
jgi:polysaccharide export outer membrane protein